MVFRNSAKAPKVDDLSEFLKHINLLVLEVIHSISNLKGTSDEYGEKEDTYYAWYDKTSNELGKMHERLLDEDIKEDDLLEAAQNFKEMIESLNILRGKENDVKDAARNNDLEGIKLERNVGTEMRRMIKSFEDEEVQKEKENLVGNLTFMHEKMEETFYENGTMIFNDAEIIAEELSELVSNSSNRLPHGHPNASSWLEEALMVKEIIEESFTETEEAMAELLELHHTLKESIENLTKLTENATNWQNEVIDERDLVAYIDLLFYMQKRKLSDEEKKKADEIIKECVGTNPIKQLDEQFKKLNLTGLLEDQQMNPILAKDLSDRAAALGAKAAEFQKLVEEITQLTKDTQSININETSINQNQTNSTLEDFSEVNKKTKEELQKLEQLINAEEEDIVRNLTEKNQAVLDTNERAENVEEDIKKIVQEMKDTIETSRRRRNLRKLKSHKRREAEISARKEIIEINQQIDQLLEEIINYRENYRVLEETHLELGRYKTYVVDPVDEMTDAIAKLKERYQNAKMHIQSCLQDDCFQKKMIFNTRERDSSERPDDCPERPSAVPIMVRP
ncbi:Oidioi.mRNA.OKI2018_I69.PAR.g9064.t1.cds [Oikopleura dioica]|uniref:Oidioi.mRNA.OKI2018_I69.PAR.g9064.t1.cds n=1 Tax=Oikopleura dioica TaxID=34765 RepID=A0ABN7RNA2_OIKDI|nr:Oidioi.mRNA.OKI2018_I69.PAR.g9064.t1.cds [Oikopleura dioica]